MNKKEFDTIAEVIRLEIEAIDNQRQEYDQEYDQFMREQEVAYITVENIRDGLAHILEKQYTAFDPIKFLKACEPESEKL